MTARSLPTVASLRRSKHESAILAAIGEGANADELLRSPRWTVNDVAQTMQRHSLVADEHGRISRKRTVDDLLRLAATSTSPYVRAKAQEAAEQMRELDHALTGRLTAAERARDQAATQAWADWLRGALTEAKAELRRLRPRQQKGA
ncbi:hypothetical protein [Labedaea rhizosphaerae]|uniref:Uncharacterized protein n=1 Tax=Labedaea rhizosphaerae TaxID=598644 RepID=A0A4R6SIS1_LABRH|nr:hypothetical protein [Labedaea rhizosphaerae]TDQ01286.1 hypothetical protein EV186_1021154 [Labedaea rhizosphaerae]